MMKFRMALAAVSVTLLMATPVLAQDVALTATFGEIELTAGFSPDPITQALVAGGGIDATTLGSNCTGFIADAPDFQVTYAAGSFPLIFSVLSDADTTLVINGPDGQWYCNDDTNGLNPVVTFEGPAQDGVYDIWVGTYRTADTADATLYISELSAAMDDGPVISGPITTGPNPTLAPAFGEANLQAGFPAATHDIPAGGTIDASALGNECFGYIAEAPDYAVNFQNIAGLLPLVFGVTSQGNDTTLVVMDPAGNWLCNDDTNGLDPEIRVQSPQAGRYLIWLGTFAADGTTVPATLSISTLAGVGGAKP